jgi:hypothetical protein
MAEGLIRRSSIARATASPSLPPFAMMWNIAQDISVSARFKIHEGHMEEMVAAQRARSKRLKMRDATTDCASSDPRVVHLAIRDMAGVDRAVEVNAHFFGSG